MLKPSLAITLFFFPVIAVAKPVALADYTAIEDAVMKGHSIKTIVNLDKHCRLISETSQLGSPALSRQTQSLTFQDFMVKETNTRLQFATRQLQVPVGDSWPHYYRYIDMTVNSQGKIHLKISLVETKKSELLRELVFVCRFDMDGEPGARFLQL